MKDKNYTVSFETVYDQEAVVLRDHANKIKVEILPDFGSNLYRILKDDEEILCGPDTSVDLNEQATKFGIPILYPPNRIKNAQFKFQDKTYHFPKNMGQHHIHGELARNPWKVVEFHADEEIGAHLQTSFRSKDHREVFSYFPFDFEFLITYRIFEGKIVFLGEVINHDMIDLPFAIGLHPYFKLPKDKGQHYTISIPVSKEWPLDKNGFICGMPRKTNLCERLRMGIAEEEIEARNGYNLFEIDVTEPYYNCEISDIKRKMNFKISKTLPYVALFKPVWTSGISVEPYTSLTDCFNLHGDYKEVLKVPTHVPLKSRIDFECEISFE